MYNTHVNGSSFFKEIGRSFIVSSLLPASVFLILMGVIFRGFLPDRLVNILIGEKSSLLGIAIASMIALWFSFLLYSGQDSIFKLFEGYYYRLGYGQLLEKFQVRQFRKKYKTIKEYLELEKEYGSEDEDLRDVFLYVRGEMQELELRTPIKEDEILPTKLGNILRASESYPRSRYGINSLTLWPRMVKFLPKDLMGELEEINNHLVFMLNSSLLSYVLTLVSLIILILDYLGRKNIAPYEIIYQSTEWGAGMGYTPAWLFVAIAIISRIGGWLFYRMGTNVAIEYGMYVRSAFDLYRHEFFEYIVETSPKDTEKDKKSWNTIGDFYIFGHKFGSRKFQIENLGEENKQTHPSNSLIIGLVVGLICKVLYFRKQKRLRIT